MQTLIFDLGGVLVDWDPRYAMRAVIDDPERLEWFLHHVCGAEFLHAVDTGTPLPEAAARWAEEFPAWRHELEAYAARWPDMVRGEVPGTAALLEDLDRAGAPLYALSNWPADTFRVARERFAVLRVFRDVVVSGEVGLDKPDPRIYRLTLERLGRAAGECVFVDDREVNVAAARACGMEGLLFTDAVAARAHPALAAWLR